MVLQFKKYGVYSRVLKMVAHAQTFDMQL